MAYPTEKPSLRKPTTPATTPEKPDKPDKGFPMFAHAGSGQWAKKVRGRLLYFGSWRNDRDGVAALETFNREYTYFKEGRTPPPVDVSIGCTIEMLVNSFLESNCGSAFGHFPAS
jgi:hypothetical protein